MRRVVPEGLTGIALQEARFLKQKELRERSDSMVRGMVPKLIEARKAAAQDAAIRDAFAGVAFREHLRRNPAEPMDPVPPAMPVQPPTQSRYASPPRILPRDEWRSQVLAQMSLGGGARRAAGNVALAVVTVACAIAGSVRG